jgi:hypothetical protein
MAKKNALLMYLHLKPGQINPIKFELNYYLIKFIQLALPQISSL